MLRWFKSNSAHSNNEYDQDHFTIASFLIYKAIILTRMKYNDVKSSTSIMIKTNFILDVLYKFIKGVSIIKIKPVKLVIKKRGYLKILFQKLFISSYSLIC